MNEFNQGNISCYLFVNKDFITNYLAMQKSRVISLWECLVLELELATQPTLLLRHRRPV